MGDNLQLANDGPDDKAQLASVFGSEEDLEYAMDMAYGTGSSDAADERMRERGWNVE